MYPTNLSSRYTDLYFTTATIKDWKPLLRPDKYKKIITDSFAFLVQEKTVWLYAFVIMRLCCMNRWYTVGCGCGKKSR